MSEMLKTAKQVLKKKKDQSYYQLMSNLEVSSWDAYPRPQLARDSYQCLNGIWKIGEQNIRLPFPPQAELSGYEVKAISDIREELLYERSFTLNPSLKKKPADRVLLHFGAVDQVAQVFVNGKPVGSHEGGYLPFSFDITDYLHKAGEENILSVFVQDHMDHRYPWGKQKKDRGGMWYTPVSGIWQTVWLEAVPKVYVKKLQIESELQLNTGEGYRARVRVKAELSGPCHNLSGRIRLPGGDWLPTILEAAAGTVGEAAAGISGGSAVRPLPDKEGKGETPELIWNLESDQIRLWSPEDPYLYPLEITAGKDRITSYFALRKIEITGEPGKQKIMLNGKPIFLAGVLDQGYFCDGLFLPANERGYEQDIRNMKALGFNMLRKHIKVEPEQFYYDCDRLGMLVMQDMVNNGPYSFIRDTGLPTIGVKIRKERSFNGGMRAEKERKAFFLKHAKDTIHHLYNHPSVIAYTVFNEGWGQFASRRVGDLLRAEDPSRIYDYTSGWFDRGGSQVESIHEYFHLKPYTQKEKPLLLSETGGYTWQIPDHSYCISDNYGYGKCQSREELTDRIGQMYEQLIYPSIPLGLCGLIYTQVSDIEDEVNGFYTYDRMVCKVDPGKVKELNEKAYALFQKMI